MTKNLMIRYFSAAPYQEIWQAMRDFTDQRVANTPDELWVVEHLPVYTLGQNGDAANILHTNNIPVVKTDRGGQVTYHGPGQLVIYFLIELKRYQLGVRQLVSLIETSVIQLLSQWNITAQARCDAPGVYVDHAKICSIGLRIRRGCSYHGLALNVSMDLTPFAGIYPCGYKNMTITQLKDLNVHTTPFNVAPLLIQIIEAQLVNPRGMSYVF